MQKFYHLRERDTAVADTVFERGLELRRGFAQPGQEEERVVAEAVCAARRVRNFAVPQALGDERTRVVGMADENHDATVIGFAVLSDGLQKLCIVARIASLPAACAARVIRGVHTRLAAERIDAEARVVGERGEAGGAAGVARLGERVLEEGGVRLVGLGDAELSLRGELDRGKDGTDLPQLAAVPRGEHEFHRMPYWRVRMSWSCWNDTPGENGGSR